MRHQVIGGGLIVATLLGVATASTVAQDAKVTEILAATRKAIGDRKLDTLKTFSVQASTQRNFGNFQSQAEVELLLEMPDKYVRSETSSGMMNMTMSTGFNGDRAIMPAGVRALPGGGMVISMGPGAAAHTPAAEKPTPEQLEQMNASSLRNYRHEVSRLMLGWFGAAHPSIKAQYTYVGEAESPDGKAHVIEVKDGDGFAARLFIDQNSKLPLMVTYQGRQRQVVTSSAGSPGTPRVTSAASVDPGQVPLVEYSLFFDDWRQVDGINFPHVIRRASKGATEEEWAISKVKVNPKLDAKIFETK